MQSLLVSGCFEIFSFSVKCAEAAWLLQVSFMECLLIAVTLDADIAILGVQNLMPPLRHLANHLGDLGTPWGTMGAAGRTHGPTEAIFY